MRTQETHKTEKKVSPSRKDPQSPLAAPTKMRPSSRRAVGLLLLFLVASAHVQAVALRVGRATVESRQVAWHGETKRRAAVPGSHTHSAFRVVLFSVCVEGGGLLVGGGRPPDGGAPVEQPALEGAAQVSCGGGKRLFGGLRLFAGGGGCGAEETRVLATLWLPRDDAAAPAAAPAGEDPAYWSRECRFELLPEERRATPAGAPAVRSAGGGPASFSAPLERVVTRGARSSEFHRLAVAAGPPPSAAEVHAAVANATSFIELPAAGSWQTVAGGSRRASRAGRVTDEEIRDGTGLPRPSLRTSAVTVDGSVEEQRRDQVRDYVSMIQIMGRADSMAHAGTRMIWELVIQPLLELLKKWIHCALEHLLAGLMMALLVPMLVDAVCAHTTEKRPDPPEPDMSPPPTDAPSTYDEQRRRGVPDDGDAAAGGAPADDSSSSSSSSSADTPPDNVGDFPAPQGNTAFAFLQLAVADRFGFRARMAHGGSGEDAARARTRAMSKDKVRAYMAGQAREAVGLGERAMDLDRFQTALEATHRSRARFVTQPLLDDLVPRLTKALENAILDQAEGMLEKAIGSDMVAEMEDYSTRTVVRRVERALVTELTLEVTDSVVDKSAQHLQKTLKEDGTGALVKALVPELTYSVTSVVAKAITRPPENDYYCFYCRERQVYCDDCRAAMEAEYYLDVYVTYYARYFEAYYTAYYADYYSKVLTNEMSSDSEWSGADAEQPRTQRCLDPYDAKCTSAVNTPDQEALTGARPDPPE